MRPSSCSPTRRGDRLDDDHRGRLRRPTWRPGSTFDLLARALERRRHDGRRPVTILSCDNLPGNGDAARRPLLGAAAAAATRARRVDRAALHVPELDGRPHHAGHHRRRPRRPAERARHRRPLARRRRAVPPVGASRTTSSAGRPRVGRRRRAVHRRRPRLGAVQAAHPQRRPLLHGLPVRPRRASRSSHEAMALPEVHGFRQPLLYDEAVPALTRDPRTPARGLRGDGARPLRQPRRARPDRPPVHRRHRQVPDVPRPDDRAPVEHGGPIRHAALALAGWARYLATTSRRPAGARQRPATLVPRLRPRGDRRPGPLPRPRRRVHAGAPRERALPRQSSSAAAERTGDGGTDSRRWPRSATSS